MLRAALNTNIAIRTIDNLLAKHDIKLEDKHKDILTILISGVVFRDGSIVIASAAINQINKILKKKKETSVDFVTLLLGFDIITHIDKYGAITIPIALIFNKLTINREVLTKSNKIILRKKVLRNLSPSLIITDLLSFFGLPAVVVAPIVNLILNILDSNIDKDFKLLVSSPSGFFNHKLSETKDILKKMELDINLVDCLTITVLCALSARITGAVILVDICDRLIKMIQTEYKSNHCSGFLN